VVNPCEVVFSSEAEASLGHLDKPVAQRILNRIKWLSMHVEDINHKSLTGRLRGTYKLRIGDYRVIYELSRETSLLTIRFIGHRSEIYK
jgi:mRNA interferase RelE/StbE